MTEFRLWRTSTRSDGGQECVEVADAVDGSGVQVRDSKERTGPVLRFNRRQWSDFINGAKGGRLS